MFIYLGIGWGDADYIYLFRYRLGDADYLCLFRYWLGDSVHLWYKLYLLHDVHGVGPVLPGHVTAARCSVEDV